MAAISSISNGEALSSVRTKLNSVITEINILDPTDWVDYSATSTIVGWSSFTTKVIKYRVIGKQIFFIVEFDGTSNSTSATFTMPSNTINSILTYGWSKNNGVSNSTSLLYSSANSNVITCYNGGSSTWTASGSKGFQCQFFIITA